MWRRHRRIVNPLMTSRYLSNMAPVIGANVRLLVEFWEQKVTAMKKYGATCFSCKNDFEYSALDTISLMVTGHSMEVTSHAMQHLNDSPPKIDQYGGAVFTYPTQPIFESIRYLITIMGHGISMPTPMARFYEWIMTFTPSYRKHYKFAFTYIRK